MTNDEFKSKLWDAADTLHGSVSAAQCKYPELALLFLKYVAASDSRTELRGTILPRLISSKLQLPEAEAVIEETIA